MTVTYYNIRIVDMENFSTCLQVSLPLNSVIKEIYVQDTEILAIVEASRNDLFIHRHFHIIPLNKLVYTDSYKYVGHAIVQYNGEPVQFVLIEIPEGEYGMYSAEYKALQNLTDKLLNSLSDLQTEQKNNEPTNIDISNDAFRLFLRDPDSGLEDEGQGG